MYMCRYHVHVNINLHGLAIDQAFFSHMHFSKGVQIYMYEHPDIDLSSLPNEQLTVSVQLQV